MADKEKALALEQAEENAAQAEREEELDEREEMEDAAVYVHTLQKPLQVGQREITELTFDFGALTGKDHNACCQRALEREGWTVVVPEFTPPYLMAMAERACTERDEKGRRVVRYGDLERMTLSDAMAIQNAARRFLRASGSGRRRSGSENNA